MLARNSRDVPFAIKCIEVLAALATGGPVGIYPQAAIDRMQAAFPSLTAFTGAGAKRVCPRWVAGWSADDSLLLVHGTDYPGQIADQTAGFRGTEFWTSYAELANPTNPWVIAASESIFAILEPTQFQRAQDMWVGGHSAGGCVAQRYAHRRILQEASSGLPYYHCVTFGSYAWANTEIASSLATIDQTRYMNSDDQMPCIPFVISRSLPSIVGFQPDSLRRLMNFRHSGQGINVPPAGAMTEANFPAIFSDSSIFSISQLLNMEERDGGQPYQLAEYFLRIGRQVMPDVPPVVPAPPGPQPVIPPLLVLPPLENNRQAQVFLNEQAVQAVIRRDEFTRDKGTIIPGERYKIRKRNGIWTVTLAGQQVVVSSGKRNARKVARQMNKLQDAGLVP